MELDETLVNLLKVNLAEHYEIYSGQSEDTLTYFFSDTENSLSTTLWILSWVGNKDTAVLEQLLQYVKNPPTELWNILNDELKLLHLNQII